MASRLTLDQLNLGSSPRLPAKSFSSTQAFSGILGVLAARRFLEEGHDHEDSIGG